MRLSDPFSVFQVICSLCGTEQKVSSRFHSLRWFLVFFFFFDHGFVMDCYKGNRLLILQGSGWPVEDIF